MPEMLKGKYQHSSCGIRDSIYVFCGSQPVNAIIEKLERATEPEPSSSWQRIEVDESVQFQPRMLPLVMALNSQDIAIFGGYDARGGSARDIWVFNTKSETFSA